VINIKRRKKMAKVPANKVKRAVKVAYLGQKPLIKMFLKTNLPVWTKAAEAEREAFLKVGAAVYADPNTTVEAATALLGSSVPAPVAGGLAATFLAQENAFAFEVFLSTVKSILSHLDTAKVAAA
jgi:hypothetical protein